MGAISAAMHNPSSIKNPGFRKLVELAAPRFIELQERRKGEGKPAAPAIDTGGADTGLSMESSVTQRKKGLKGRRGLMIGSSGSTGGTTGTGLNV